MMQKIYKNDYGISYLVDNHPNSKYTLQLVINNLGIYMSVPEMKNLLNIVRSSYKILEEGCNCEQCRGKKLSRLWKINKFFEICLKIDDTILNLLEDLIVGTQFILNVNEVLEDHSIK